MTLPAKTAAWFALAYLGFLTQLTLEGLFLMFERDTMPAEKLESIRALMATPSTVWLTAAVVTVTLLPIWLALLVHSRAAWRTIAVIGGLVTLLHAAHYAGELNETGAIGVVAMFGHVVPSLVATRFAWRSAPATGS